MQKSVEQITCFDRRDLKQMSVRGETELSGRNINTEDVSKVSGTRLSQLQKRNRWKKLVVDSLTDWQPVGEHVEAEKHAHGLVTGSEYSGCVVSDTLDQPVRLEEKQRSPYDLMLTDRGRERTFAVLPDADRS